MDVQALQTPQSVLQSDINEVKNTQIELKSEITYLKSAIATMSGQMQMLLQNQAARPVPLTTSTGAVNKTLGPRLQQIDPTTLQIVKVYDTFSECLKIFNTNMHQYALGQHMKKNIAYFGYRWRYVERTLDPNVIHGDIVPTQAHKEKVMGYVAKLTPDRSQILAVYINRKTAAIMNGYSSTGLDMPIAKDTIAKGYRYMAWDMCPEQLTAPFEEKYGTVVLYENGVAQYQGDQLVTEYSSKHECYNALNMSDKTMRKLLESGSEYEGFRYVAVTNKLFMGAAE
jgi:hypothetical protein